MADIAEAKVELPLGEIRNRARTIAEELKASSDWSVKFALKVRKIGKIFESVGEPSIADINDETAERDKTFQKSITELQEKFIKKNIDGSAVIDDKKKLTFDSEDKKAEYFGLVKELNKAYNKYYEDLDDVLKQKVEVAANTIPKDVQPEKIKGKLFDAIAEFLEE